MTEPVRAGFSITWSQSISADKGEGLWVVSSRPSGSRWRKHKDGEDLKCRVTASAVGYFPFTTFAAMTALQGWTNRPQVTAVVTEAPGRYLMCRHHKACERPAVEPTLLVTSPALGKLPTLTERPEPEQDGGPGGGDGRKTVVDPGQGRAGPRWPALCPGAGRSAFAQNRLPRVGWGQWRPLGGPVRREAAGRAVVHTVECWAHVSGAHPARPART